jgi:predicted acyl esterase
MKISGFPSRNLFASTSGTDSDWVVKLIDVYRTWCRPRPELGGYQLGVADGYLSRALPRELRTPSPIPADMRCKNTASTCRQHITFS